MTLASGTRLGAYEIIGPLGSGGMGAVYRARDLNLGRDVAIKILLPALAQDSDALARFEREARAASALNHPHIVQIYEIAAAPTAAGVTHYIAMELVEGMTLRAHLGRGGRRMDLVDALIPVADALARAHRAGIVHRDLKPENILITSDGYPKVVDFGLAKLAEASERADGRATVLDANTGTGVTVGTVGYMAPEQVHGSAIDQRADIFSFGCVLYEVAAGRPAFKGESSVATLHAVAYDDPAPIESLNPSAPPELRRIVGRCLAKAPRDRYQAMSDVAADLRALMRGRGAPAPDAPTTMATRASSVRRHVSRYGLRWALVAVLIAGAAVAVWRRWPGAPASRTAGDGNRLVVAVTPFYGPDDESAKEGKVMAVMVERAITNRLGAENATVVGVDETKQPVRSHDAARALGATLGATMVVWGEAFALRGETEIQPYFTMVPREQRAAEANAAVSRQAAMLADPSAALNEREAGPTVLQAQAANQIELRRTSAAGVGDIVLLLAGTHALYTEGKAEKALALFRQAPRTAESLRYQTEALLRLNRNDEALRTLTDAAALAPGDAKTFAMLGDVHMAADRFQDAVAAYRRASEIGGPYTTREAILYDGKLYAREMSRNLFRSGPAPREDTGYMLACDQATGKVLERYRLPGPLRAFTPLATAIEITYDMAFGPGRASRYARIGFSTGRFEQPVFYGTSLLLRRQAINSAEGAAANFASWGGSDTFATPRKQPRSDAPRTLSELEMTTRRAFERDPTQPWHLFLLGQALWSEGRRDEATETWTRMFAGTFPAIPYYEYMKMAHDFERFGQRPWADRAFDEALARRRRLPQQIEASFWIERVLNGGFATWQGTDVERTYTWLERSRQISGVTEGDDLVAALWQRYFRERGDLARARAEAEYFDRVRANPYSHKDMAYFDYATYVFWAASLAFWSIAIVFFLARRSNHGSVSASMSPEERAALVVALTLAVISAVPVWILDYRLNQLFSALPVSDSFGHANFIQALEDRLKRSDTKELRFAAAVAHHLAGDTTRAEELYESLPQDSRVATNLDALRKGVLTPPDQLTVDDVFRAYTVAPVSQWPSIFWYGLGHFEISPPPLAVFNVDWIVGVAVLVALWRRPARTVSTPDSARPMGGRSRFARTVSILVPGLFDLQIGLPWRGMVILELFLFALFAGVGQLLARVTYGPVGAPGLATANWSASILRSLPFPTQSGQFDAATRAQHWTLFWAYPSAKLFWSIVALALVTSLALHLARLREIRARSADATLA